MAWPLQGDILLPNLQRLSGGDGNLVAHDVDGRDLLGHRMFDLNARVHFHEIEMPVLIQKKLDRAGIVVLHRSSDGDRGLAHLGAQLGREDERRRDFDQFLVAPLNGAIAFPEVNDIAVLVRQDLEFDMVGTFDIFFDEDAAVAECRLGLPRGHVHIVPQFLVRTHDPQASPPASGTGFDHDGIAGAAGEGQGLFGGAHPSFRAGDDGHTGLFGDLARLDLTAHQKNGLRRRADEGDARGLAQMRELCVFRKKPIPGMDGIGADTLGEIDDLLHVEKAL